jgi:hypothetical protein
MMSVMGMKMVRKCSIDSLEAKAKAKVPGRALHI